MKRLLIVATVIGLVACVAKKRSAEQSSWQGLTEDQAREKLNDKLPGKMPEEKREMVADKIVSKMRDKGVIVDIDLIDDNAAAESNNGDQSDETAETAV